MKQMIIGGFNAAADTGAVNSNTLQGGSDWQGAGNEVYCYEIASSPGTLSNLEFKVNTAPGAGKNWTLVLYKNGSATALSAQIANAATTGIDNTHSVTIAAGDYLYLSCTPSGTPTGMVRARWSTLFTGTNAKESLIMGANSTYAGSSIFMPVMNAGTSNGTVESQTIQVIPTGGTIKNLYVWQSDTAGGSGTMAYTYTLRKNNASTALTATLTQPATTGNDTTHSVSVVAGDRISFEVDPISSPGNSPLCSWGFTFVATTDGESIIMGSLLGYASPSTNYYAYPSTYKYDVANDTTEANWFHEAQAGPVLKSLYAYIDGTSSSNVTFTIRKNSASSGIVATITTGNTSGSDTSHTYTTADYDDLDIQFFVNGGSLPNTGSWGFVCYYATAVIGPIQAIPLGFIHGS